MKYGDPNCTHAVLGFQSGDHEIYCRLCNRMWITLHERDKSNQSKDQMMLCGRSFRLTEVEHDWKTEATEWKDKT